ncbi:MAG: hypothetical protein FWD80_03205, partial [Propionibacteriaceae bacterium]|nr:hypothetical protein [Propionibacteriaceae bacterium]
SSWTASLDEARWGGAACVSGGQIGAVELPIEASDHGVVTVAVTVDGADGVIAVVYTTQR